MGAPGYDGLNCEFEKTRVVAMEQQAGVSSGKRIRVTSTPQVVRSEPSLKTITLQSAMREIRQLREERSRMRAKFDLQLRERDNELHRMEERFQQ